jgi:hypothetical protein
MHKKITCLALAGKCVIRGAKKFSFSAAMVDNPANARYPNPIPAVFRTCRRDIAGYARFMVHPLD